MIKILLADDQFVILEGIKAILEYEPEIEIVGTAQDGQIAIAQAKELRPDILLIDIEMPRMNGIQATKYIRKYLPNTKVIVLTSHKNQDYIAEALLAGASGYLLKDSLIKNLKQEIYSFGRGYSAIKAELLTQTAKKNSTTNVVEYREKIIYFKKYRKSIYKPAANQKIRFDISFRAGGRMRPRSASRKRTESFGLPHVRASKQRSRKTPNVRSLNADITKANLPPRSKPASTKKIPTTKRKTSSPLGFNHQKYLKRIIWLLLAISSMVLSIIIF